MSDIVLTALGAASLLAWLWLLMFRGGFWRADQRLAEATQVRASWPQVVAVIPARNEAQSIGAALLSLLRQDYPGDLRVVVVDDASEDETAARARAADDGAGRVQVVRSETLPPGWSGKVWAMAQGVNQARTIAPHAEFYLLTDADIEHAPDGVRRLVDKALSEGLVLASLMVMLHGRGFWERLLLPAFVFFFQKLYPFRWVNDPRRGEAAAAGGCMLVRADILEAIGGIAAVRDRLIDDCALAARIKRHGAIWLGLAKETRSLRTYDGLEGLWSMVARTAFTQLRHSSGALIATVAGMVLVYLVPPVALGYGIAALPGGSASAVAGAAAWTTMIAAVRPTLALYGLGWWWGALLPFAALLFTVMTLDSARLHWHGCGGKWKGRSYGAVRSGGA